MATVLLLKRISLRKDRVDSWQEYPFCVPAIASMDEIELTSPVCFFVGENGSGKSTLLEAIAAHYGFGREGGNRNYQFETSDSSRAIDPLVRALRLGFSLRTGAGFYLRAESFFNTASYADDLARAGSSILAAFDGKSLHARSHGESFLALLKGRFNRSGLYLMDEPEAALSPQRQLSMLVMIRDLVRSKKDAQFIISTHSPILLAYPGAQILSFDEGNIHPIEYRDTPPYTIMSSFVQNPEGFLRHLFADEDAATGRLEFGGEGEDRG